MAGVKAGELHQGHFNASQTHYLEVWVLAHFALASTYAPVTLQGMVATPSFVKPVLLVGRAHMNRAVHGDIVVVQVFPEAEWKAPAGVVVDQDGLFCLELTLALILIMCFAPTNSCSKERRRG